MNSTILKDAKGLIEQYGASHASYGHGDSPHCFIGAVAEAEGQETGYTRYSSKAYKHVITACRSLLPGWNHDSINGGASADTLPEAVLCRAFAQDATTEIALIVMNRAIKLAETDEAEVQAVADGRLADEAEMVAHGATREDDLSFEEYAMTTIGGLV